MNMRYQTLITAVLCGKPIRVQTEIHANVKMQKNRRK